MLDINDQIVMKIYQNEANPYISFKILLFTIIYVVSQYDQQNELEFIFCNKKTPPPPSCCVDAGAILHIDK